ncbi:epidermal retinol dehydrogenase 2-like [Zootermopsis nevadensis]|uniref:Short-chain dehydrogenase/reductase 3 n=1 Tax=Zootermopsis nevadensis TaxID=136037 RepID=A0A067QRK2_ZOONE|nr:epidermal retinol dehydrogenase 2-like [Zootermopsis nevadensis]KDR12385.1 Epidermal retinal dehydrogenase 2 [Zootermopsis nevadensis]
MLLRVYSLLVLIYDVLSLIFLIIKASLEAFYHVFFPPHQKSVGGEIVLVAGAGCGIGRELAIQFSILGATVICWDIQAGSNEETAIKAESLGYGAVKAYAYTCDITKRDQVHKTAQRVKKDVGNVTVIINCCNLPSPRVRTRHPAPDVCKTLDVGVMSHFWILQAFLPSMQQKKHGHIVMLTSVAGLAGISNLVPLSATQFAVQGLAESLNEELRNYRSSGDVKLTLVHIYPFIVDNEMSTNVQLRIPSYFGTIEPVAAARKIIDAMRRDYVEVSIPGYLLYVGKVVSLLPRKAIIAMRELLDTGVDFG